MKGYKGFEPGMICMNKQYTENALFEEYKVELGHAGMHFCKEPFQTWAFYSPYECERLNEFAKIDALGDVCTNGDLFCTNRLMINKKLTLPQMVDAELRYIRENDKPIIVDKDSAHNAKAAIANRPCSVAAVTRGNAVANAVGGQSAAISTEFRSAAKTNGLNSTAVALGRDSVAVGEAFRSVAIATGRNSVAISRDPRSLSIVTSEDSLATSYRDDCIAMATGPCSDAVVEGSHSVAIAAGYHDRVKGMLGCWLVAMERSPVTRFITDVKTAYVDGVKIKANTFYELKNGEFVESTQK